MPNQNKKRIRNLIVIFSITAVVLSVSTYAWFIGMRTVNVSSFDVEIASTDSLLLSLDGATWNTTVSIDQGSMNDASYTGNTNSWGGSGLVPMSSVGAMDSTVSRMNLFEKASLTSTAGGYRLLSSRVKNYGVDNTGEQDGYVAFDLFVKNFSGTQYNQPLEVLDEEAIYLTNDASVTVAEAGVENTGIENSVRVAFAQIGRVAGTTTDATSITGITCLSDATVTGICRTAQIWEANDTKHVANAISWYDTSCLKRIDPDVTNKDSYNGACGTVTDGIAYPTYAVTGDITAADKVDVYDGPAYNGYVPTVSLLSAYPYFTDTMKLFAGTKRPSFMTLAPNSITKVRIYIYIEGQDVDNYDFASIGKAISVKFGFTKERYTEDDIEYAGPNVNEGDGPDGADTTDPVIKLLGSNPQELTVNTEETATYEDPGATAFDPKIPENVDLTTSIVKSGTVNIAKAGTYTVVYTVKDAAGNIGTKTRTVIVQ